MYADSGNESRNLMVASQKLQTKAMKQMAEQHFHTDGREFREGDHSDIPEDE